MEDWNPLIKILPKNWKYEKFNGLLKKHFILFYFSTKITQNSFFYLSKPKSSVSSTHLGSQGFYAVPGSWQGIGVEFFGPSDPPRGMSANEAFHRRLDWHPKWEFEEMLAIWQIGNCSQRWILEDDPKMIGKIIIKIVWYKKRLLWSEIDEWEMRMKSWKMWNLKMVTIFVCHSLLQNSMGFSLMRNWCYYIFATKYLKSFSTSTFLIFKPKETKRSTFLHQIYQLSNLSHFLQVKMAILLINSQNSQTKKMKKQDVVNFPLN